MAGKNTELIYNNEGDGFWFRFKARFGQIFKRNNNKKQSNIDVMVRANLDDLQTDDEFGTLSRDEKMERTFENFYTINIKDRDYISSLSDVNELGMSLAPTGKRERNKKDGFYKLIAEPLNELAGLSEGSERYNELKGQLEINMDKYLSSHNPSSTAGKARCEFVERLRAGLTDREKEDITDEIEDDEMKPIDQVEADKITFDRYSKRFSKVKSSLYNSPEYNKIEGELKKAKKMLKELDLNNKEQKLSYIEALGNICKAADKYLEHKEKDGKNAKDEEKISFAIDLKDYAHEQRKKLYEDELFEATRNNYQEAKEHYSEEIARDAYCKELDAIDTFDRLESIYEKEYGKKPGLELREALRSVQKGLNDIGSGEIEGVGNKETGAILLASFLREELNNGCGDVTPLMKEYFKDPSAVQKAFEQTMAAKKLAENVKNNENNVKVFLDSSHTKNVEDAMAFNYDFSNKQLMESIKSHHENNQKERNKAEKENKEIKGIEKTDFAKLQKAQKEEAFRSKRTDKVMTASMLETLAKKNTDNSAEYQERARKIRDEIKKMDKKATKDTAMTKKVTENRTMKKELVNSL